MISQVKLMLLVVGAAFGDGSKVPELSGIKVVAPISQLERLKKNSLVFPSFITKVDRGESEIP